MTSVRFLPVILLLAAACQSEDVAVTPPAPSTAGDSAAVAVQPDSQPTEPRPETADPNALTPNGWGPLTIGMTEEEVVAAVGPDANPDAVGGPEPEVCDVWQPEGHEGMLLMFENGLLSRITLIRDSEIRTDRGVGLGATAEEVMALYGDEAESTPHKYSPPPAAYITFWQTAPPAENPRGIVYEIGPDGTVTQIRGGGPAIRYVEGCA